MIDGAIAEARRRNMTEPVAKARVGPKRITKISKLIEGIEDKSKRCEHLLSKDMRESAVQKGDKGTTFQKVGKNNEVESLEKVTKPLTAKRHRWEKWSPIGVSDPKPYNGKGLQRLPAQTI